MDTILPVLGLMVCMYTLAEFVGAANRKLEAENKMPFLQTILTIIGIGLLFCSAPVGLINMLHDSRIKKQNDQENAERYDALRQIDTRQIKDLSNQVKILEEEKWDIRFEEYDRGQKAGYKSGYIDGYVASCEKALPEESLHLQYDWQWKNNARSSAQESLAFKEYMDQVQEEILFSSHPEP